MADAVVILPDDSSNTGKKTDTSSLTVSAQTVHRQRNNLADPTVAAAIAKVLAALPALADYGLVVRQAPSADGWGVTHAPAANTQAVASKGAGGAGVRHIFTGGSVTFANGAAAPTAALVVVNLRDGATGAGSILHTWTLAIEAVAGKVVHIPLVAPEKGIPGTANTAMTLETSASPGANVSASVNLFGHSAS